MPDTDHGQRRPTVVLHPVKRIAIVPCALVAAAVFVVAGCPDYTTADTPPDAGAPIDGATSSSSGSSGASSSSTSSSSSSSSSGGSSSSSSGGYPPPCDTAVDLTKIDCSSGNRSACGSELPASTLLKPDDLVECDSAGKAKCVRHCSEGCVPISSLPSQCGNCLDPNNSDIWYCGKQVGFTPESADVVFHCLNGRASGSPGVCGKDLCHKACTRTSPPPLPGACCQSTPE